MRDRQRSRGSVLSTEVSDFTVMKVPAWPRTQLYKRVFRISLTDIRTVNPATGRTTNCWHWRDFVGVTLTGDSFMLSVRRQRSSRIDSLAFCSVGSVSERLVRTLRSRHAQHLLRNRQHSDGKSKYGDYVVHPSTSSAASAAPPTSAASPTASSSVPSASAAPTPSSASAAFGASLPSLNTPSAFSRVSVVSADGSPDGATTPGPLASSRVNVRIALPEHTERGSLLLSLRKTTDKMLVELALTKKLGLSAEDGTFAIGVYEGVGQTPRQLRRGECPAAVLLDARMSGAVEPTFCFQRLERWSAAMEGVAPLTSNASAMTSARGGHARRVSTLVVDSELEAQQQQQQQLVQEERAVELEILNPFFATLERASRDRPDLLQGVGTACAFEIGSAVSLADVSSASPPHVWLIDPSGGGSVAYAESSRGAACTLRLRAVADFVALYEGRLKPVQALWKGQLKIVGDAKVLKRLWPLMKHAGTMATVGVGEDGIDSEYVILEGGAAGDGTDGAPMASAIEVERLQEELAAQVRRVFELDETVTTLMARLSDDSARLKARRFEQRSSSSRCGVLCALGRFSVAKSTVVIGLDRFIFIAAVLLSVIIAPWRGVWPIGGGAASWSAWFFIDLPRFTIAIVAVAVVATVQRKVANRDRAEGQRELFAWVEQNYRRFVVYRTVIRIMFSYKWAELREAVQYTTGGASDADDIDAMWDALNRRNARLLYRVALSLGGMWVKAAQYLGSRPDLLPHAYVAELSKLHDKVPARSFAQVEATIKSELQIGDLREVFLSFEKRPIAAASVGQVHRAVLRTGESVAVKVQHAGVDVIIQQDVVNLATISKWLAKAKGFHHIEKTLREWSAEVMKELDFRREASIQNEIRANIAASTDRDVTAVGVPAIIPGMQTRRVLAMMFVEGVKVTDLRALRRMGADPERIVAQLTAAHAHQVFVNGLFHGDPHAGNILVSDSTQDGEEPHPMLLDFGCVKRMENDSVRLGFARMVVAANQLDYGQIEQAFGELGLELNLGGKGSTMGMSALRFMFRDSAPVEEARAQVKEREQLIAEEKNAVREEQISEEEEIAKGEGGEGGGSDSESSQESAKDKALIGEWPPELVFFMRSNELLRGLAIELGVRHPTLNTMARLARCALRLEALKHLVVSATSLSPTISTMSITEPLQVGVRELLRSLRKKRQILGIQLSIAHPSCGVVDFVAGELGELDPRPVAVSSLFCLFGLSPVIAVGALMGECAERGIDLDVTVQSQWPALVLPSTKSSLTIRELLTGCGSSVVEKRLPASMSFKTLLQPEVLIAAVSAQHDDDDDDAEEAHAQGIEASRDAPAHLTGWWEYGWGAALDGFAQAVAGVSLQDLVRFNLFLSVMTGYFINLMINNLLIL